MQKRSFWEVLSWIAFVIIMLYLLGKITGVLNSPLSIDIAAVISVAYFIGRYAKRIDDTFKDVKDIKEDVKTLDKNCPVFKSSGTKTR